MLLLLLLTMMMSRPRSQLLDDFTGMSDNSTEPIQKAIFTHCVRKINFTAYATCAKRRIKACTRYQHNIMYFRE